MVWSEGNMSPGIDPGTVRLVAQRLNHYATPGPHIPGDLDIHQQSYKNLTSCTLHPHILPCFLDSVPVPLLFILSLITVQAGHFSCSVVLMTSKMAYEASFSRQNMTNLIVSHSDAVRTAGIYTRYTLRFFGFGPVRSVCFAAPAP